MSIDEIRARLGQNLQRVEGLAALSEWVEFTRKILQLSCSVVTGSFIAPIISEAPKRPVLHNFGPSAC